MQKIIRICFFIGAFLCLSQHTAFAEEVVEQDVPPEYSVTESDESFIGTQLLSELIIRPVAVIGSIAGVALFLVASPVASLASISKPHDALKTTWNDFVVTPYHFAFRRQFGDYSIELN